MAAQFSSRWRWNKCPPAFKRTGPIEFTGFIIVKELGSEENRPRNSDKSSSCLVSFDGRRNHSRRRGLLGTESWVAWRCLWTNQNIFISIRIKTTRLVYRYKGKKFSKSTKTISKANKHGEKRARHVKTSAPVTQTTHNSCTTKMHRKFLSLVCKMQQECTEFTAQSSKLNTAGVHIIW